MKHSEQIRSHPFVDEVIADSGPVLRQLLSPKQRPTRRSEPERYFWSVRFYIHNLCDSFTRLEHIRTYLAHIRISKQYRQDGITRTSYIEYHSSNHAVILVGIFDIALILTSNVFRLGIAEKQCRSDLIMQNAWVHERGIDRILRQLDSAVSPLREPRNLFAHRGIPRMDEFLTALGEYDALEEKGLLKKMPNRSKVELVYKEKISGILDELGKREESAFNPTMELLTGLHPVYNSWKKFFATQEK